MGLPVSSTACNLFACNISGLIESLVSHLISLGWGTPDELRSVTESIMMAVTRAANEFRKAYFIDTDSDGNLITTRKHKDGTKKWLVNAMEGPKRPGCLVKFLDETLNKNDEFIRDFVTNPDVAQDPIFVDSLNRIKVSFLIIFSVNV